MDPLSALRDFTTRGDLDQIVRVGDEFRFGNAYAFPCNSETAYRSKQGGLYTLESLIFYVQNAHVKHTDYIQLARSRRIQPVTFTDRKPLLDYLHGKISSTDAVETLIVRPSSPATAAAADDVSASTALPSATAAPPDDEPASLEPPIARIRVSEGAIGYTSAIRVLERPLKDRDALLECRTRDFYSILASSTARKDEERSRRDGGKENGEDHDGSHYGRGKELGKAKLFGGKAGEGVPIILVPSAFQTLITIYNVKEFLEDGVFVPTDVKVKQMRESKMPKPDCVTVQKKLSRDRAVAAYEVRDKPSGMKTEDWDRVVAVFVLGKEWQFKDWPFKDHVEIFNKIIGFYMRFEDDSVESAKLVKQWNVKIISISKNKRHHDRAAALEVWEKLEEFVQSRAHG
ncbi:protein CDC73 homolog [Nymphaea colorata]|nr:protein CDC73 homolog [Nymphaea colorata]